MSNARHAIEAEINEVLCAYHTAMVEARVDELEKLLDKNFSLTHITGYVQPKDEWLNVIRSGEFNYHDIHIDKQALSLKIIGSHATIKGKGVFDATINGMHAPWRLQFDMACSKQGERWKVMFALYQPYAQ
jgi:hypothetical protein